MTSQHGQDSNVALLSPLAISCSPRNIIPVLDSIASGINTSGLVGHQKLDYIPLKTTEISIKIIRPQQPGMADICAEE